MTWARVNGSVKRQDERAAQHTRLRHAINVHNWIELIRARFIENNQQTHSLKMEGIYAFADQIKVYKAILDATQEIQKWLRYHSGKFIAYKLGSGCKLDEGADLV